MIFGIFLAFQRILKGLGVLIIPKLLILTSGDIALLFGSFLGLPKKRLNMNPQPPSLLKKYFKTYKKNMETFLENLIVAYLRIRKFENVGKYVCQSFRLYISISIFSFVF